MERGTTRRARLYASSVEGNVAVLDPDEAHHVTRVIRLKQGDGVGVFDGAGHEWSGSIARVTSGAVEVSLETTEQPVPEPAVHVTLALGMLKGDAMAEAVRDATVLGVRRIVP